VIVDIDECAAGGIASSCNSTVGGVCVGVLPGEKFQCTCQGGWELVPSGNTCQGELILRYSMSTVVKNSL